MLPLRIILVIIAGTCASTARGQDAADSFVVPDAIQSIIKSHCESCHAGDSTEGNVRFDMIAKFDLETRLELLNKAQEQLYFGLMPPGDEEQPSEAERAQFVDWTSGELRKHNASRLDEKLRKPEYGNYVDHDKLFSGEHPHLKSFIRDRRWLISESHFQCESQSPD